MSSKSTSDSHIPQFPDEREDFPMWKNQMEGYLLSRGLAQVILGPTDLLKQKTRLADLDYKVWLEAHYAKVNE